MSIFPYPIPMTSYVDETIPFHLTIADIIKLKKGDMLNILCFDRNIMDLVPNVPNKVYHPNEFFVKAYQGTYIHEKDLSGQIMFPEFDSEPSPFEFHLEYCYHSWYPLKNGKLISQGDPCGVPEKFNNKTWRSFSKTTRVGWRGPMVLKNQLDYFPHVYNMPPDIKQKVHVLMNR